MIRNFLDKIKPLFEENGKLSKLYPLYEAIDTFLYSTDERTTGACHIRDAIDTKRIMTIVVIALFPCMFMAMYNTGLQANILLNTLQINPTDNWRIFIIKVLGIGFNPNSIIANIIHGALYFIPIYLVTLIVGGTWEVIFALVRKHEINEGFLVTSALFPLILPPTIPLWQVAIGISFGVVFGKEVFGGTGRNFLNPALCGRVFLFFAYPAQISGDKVWVALDGISKPTPLGIGAIEGINGIINNYDFWQALLGFIPGSMGETSVIACIIGALILIVTGIGSWRIMLSILVGAISLSSIFYFIGSETNPMFSLPPHWHLVIGGFAFGLVFMATDPVSAPITAIGQFIYGVLIGFMVILIRVINPAFPEGVMLAILFANTFAPLIDYFVVHHNIKRRMLRSAK